MPNIQRVDVRSKTIVGYKTRTNNANPEKIGALWGMFIAEVNPQFPHYGVYYNFESDVHGDYDILAGIEDEPHVPFESVTIQEGRYLKFSAKGELPEAVMQCWEQIWAYFQDPSIDERRAYDTDFEVYRSMHEVEVYIGVHYF